MASRAPQSSQVSLFNAQVGEQIQRLRTLTGSAATPTGNEAVDLKRAVMATRLLAGSARILQLDALTGFLDRLLAWLQQIEAARQPLTTTQSMMLESAIDLEERIMRHLENAGPAFDLAVFGEELSDLTQLIERGGGDRIRRGEASESELVTSAATDPSDAALPLVDALRAVTESVEALAEAGDVVALPAESAARLRGLARRLEAALVQLHGGPSPQATPAATSVQAPAVTTAGGTRPRPRTMAIPSVARAPLHPMLEGLRPRLLAHERALGMPVAIEVHLVGRPLPKGVEEVVADILAHLIDDIAATCREAPRADSDGLEALEVIIDLTEDQGRMLVSIADNAPAHPSGGGLDDADHLVLYKGLRQARALVEQLNGLIWVEPQQAPQSRFILSLPMELRDQTYRVIDLGQVQVAVPWVLIDDIAPTEGLMFHADATGESFNQFGRSIALVDLAEYVQSLIPRDDPAEHIAIVGSVEKRLGIFCEGVGDLVDATGIAPPPKGWEQVAYGSLELAGDKVPLLDIGRILRLRFGGQGGGMQDVAGSIQDPVLDTYVPVPDLTTSRGVRPVAPPIVPQPVAPAAPAASTPLSSPAPPELPGKLRALLINQSDFRRRDLARTLEGMGYEVMATAELVRGLHYLEQQHVELIVTDLRLGDNGLENVARLRDGQLNAPVVLTSSVAREYADELARKTGANACWLDPFRVGDLEAILSALA